MCSKEPVVQWLSFVDMVHKCHFFWYKLDRWFSCLNGFTLVICRALYSLLFGVSHVSVLTIVL